MDYGVGKIPAAYRIDADKHQAKNERKKNRLVQKTENRDSISISEEARQRSASAETDSTEGEAPEEGLMDQVTK